MSETGIEVLERLREKPLSAKEREMFIRMGKEVDCAEEVCLVAPRWPSLQLPP